MQPEPRPGEPAPGVAPDPLAPLDPSAFLDPGTGPGPGTAGRTRDRRGRGIRHPWPLGQKARRTRREKLVAAVELAVERLGALHSPALTAVTVAVRPVPDHADELLRRLQAGDRPGPEQLFSSVSVDAAGAVLVTLHERALLNTLDPEDMDAAVYATIVARCAEVLGRSPEDLDPDWGSL